MEEPEYPTAEMKSKKAQAQRNPGSLQSGEDEHASNQDLKALDEKIVENQDPLAFALHVQSDLVQWEEELDMLQMLFRRKISGLEDEKEADELKGILSENNQRIFTPQLNYVSWDTMLEHGSGTVPRLHYAIDILHNEPTHSQLESNFDEGGGARSKTANQSRHSTLSCPKSFADGKELPERIRINSERIVVVLDYDLWDKTLAWDSRSHTAFVILRPFKILVYLDSAIRNRLREFEEARFKLKRATEEQYLEDFKTDPAQDRPSISRQDESSMDVSSLTGTINDLRCLIKFMDDFLVPTRSRDDQNQVRFSDLWYVFPQGCLVTVRDTSIS